MTQGVLDMVKAGDGKSATQESVNENGQEQAYLIQMTITSTTIGKNTLEEMK